MSTVYDLIIVGAGPCGLACAIEAKKQGLHYLVLEKGSIAESIRRYPIHMQFFSTADNISIADIPFAVADAKANRSEALQYYRKVSEYFQLNLQLFTEVKSIRKQEKGIFEIKTSKAERLQAHKVVLAIGYFDCPRQLEVPGSELAHVKQYYDEPFGYTQTKVSIIGGGNSAVEAALDLYRHGAQVTMLLRGADFKPTAKYWLIPDLRNRVKEGHIKVYFNSEVLEIQAQKIIAKNKTGEQFSLESDFVLSLIGYTSDTDFMQACGIDLVDEYLTPHHDPQTYESNVEGLYLAGTAICGTQTEKVFIENGRHHGKAIVADIKRRTSTGGE